MKALVLVLCAFVGMSTSAEMVRMTALPQEIQDTLIKFTDMSPNCRSAADMEKWYPDFKARVETLAEGNQVYFVPCAIGAHNPVHLVFQKVKDFSHYELMHFADWSSTADGIQGANNILGNITFDSSTGTMIVGAGGGGYIEKKYQIVSVQYAVASKLISVQVDGKTVFPTN